MGSKVSPVCPALRAELSSLLGRRRAAFDTLGHVQSASQRVDALCAEVRGCVADSGLRYVDGELAHYEDGCYVPIRRDALMMTLANVLYSLGVGASDVRRMADLPLSVLWDMSVESDPMLVRFDDCVLNLRTGRRSPHSPSLPVTWRMPYAYGDGRPEAPEWEAFLSEVVPDVAERACLQEFFGLCLIDRRSVSVEKMAIFVGGGAILSDAAQEVTEFVRKMDAPITSSLMGHGAFPETDPLYTGMIGMHGTKTSNFAVTKCDLLITIGARFSDRVTGNTKTFAKNAKILQIDVDPAEINKNVKVDAAVIGDVKVVLRELNRRMPQLEHKEWVEWVEDCEKKYPAAEILTLRRDVIYIYM